jgi:hypothetical protein
MSSACSATQNFTVIVVMLDVVVSGGGCTTVVVDVVPPPPPPPGTVVVVVELVVVVLGAVVGGEPPPPGLPPDEGGLGDVVGVVDGGAAGSKTERFICKNVKRYLQFFGVKVSNEFLLRGHTVNTLVRPYGVIVIDKSPQLGLAMF